LLSSRLGIEVAVEAAWVVVWLRPFRNATGEVFPVVVEAEVEANWVGVEERVDTRETEWRRSPLFSE